MKVSYKLHIIKKQII